MLSALFHSRSAISRSAAQRGPAGETPVPRSSLSIMDEEKEEDSKLTVFSFTASKTSERGGR